MQEQAQNAPAVFTPEAVAAINRAYVEACHIVAEKGIRDELRFALAERMMFLARSGETDERRLCNLSVAAVLGREPSRDREIRVIHDA